MCFTVGLLWLAPLTLKRLLCFYAIPFCFAYSVVGATENLNIISKSAAIGQLIIFSICRTFMCLVCICFHNLWLTYT